jgi:hypothetical protein
LPHGWLSVGADQVAEIARIDNRPGADPISGGPAEAIGKLFPVKPPLIIPSNRILIADSGASGISGFCTQPNFV